MEPDTQPTPKIQLIKNQIIIDKYVETHNQAPTVNNNKKPKEKLNIEKDDVQRLRQQLLTLASLQMDSNLEQVAARTQFVKQKIAPLNHKQTEQFGKILEESIINYFEDRIKTTKQVQKNIRHSIQTFILLMTSFKECSVNFTISSITLTIFKHFWHNSLRQLKSTEYIKNELLNAWRYIPYQLLDTFLKEFGLMKDFHSIDIQKFFTLLSVCFFQNKIQQGCQYYRLFKHGKKLNKEQLKIFQNYQYEHIVPRISKKDQLFSQYVIALIKNDKDIATKMFKILQIHEYQKIIKLTGKNIQQHPQIIQHAMKKQYHDLARRSRQWYIIEDKISFSNDYIKWFTQDIKKCFDKNQPKPEHNQHDKHEEKHNFCIKSEEEADAIIQSMLIRANIIKKQNKQLNYIQNPLYQHDDYIPAQYILADLDPINKKITETYLTLEHFGINSKDVVFVDSIDETFNQATSFLLNAEIVGFDSEFWATTNKYEEGGIAIIQLATQHRCFIFDYHSLKEFQQFDQFFITFMENEQIIKVGHTVSSDLKFLYKTFNKEIKIASMVDLAQLLKKHYKSEVYSSLAYMSEKFIGKKMCKYEQRSNWNRRPLKKTQICYACLDAIACVEIYLKMQKQKVNLVNRKKSSSIPKKKKEPKQNDNQSKDITQDTFNFQKFKDFLENPIFLVDNMLKKLCTTMRNCGIDTQFISIKDYQLAMSRALKEKRIFITRDSKLSVKKFANVPIYQLKERSDSDIMFKQLIQIFNIDLNQYQTLSRCVKCNNPEIIIITGEEARKQINFVYQNSQISVFWRCTQCKQIYWEGGQFKKAKTKYQQLRK